VTHLAHRLTMLAGIAAPLFALAIASSPALAQESNTTSQWAIGIGVGTQNRPYRDADSETRVLPLLIFENRWVRVAGLGAELKLYNDGPFSLGLAARYSLSGYESDDAPILNGMDERKGGLWVGPTAGWRTGFGNFTAELLGDASGHSKGTQVKLGVDQPFPMGDFRFTPRLATIWRDAKYVDYYYGVEAHEVHAGRPLYEGRSTTDYELGLRTDYRITPNHSVFLDLSATGFGKAVKDSPLVDRTTQTSVRLGYVYRF